MANTKYAMTETEIQEHVAEWDVKLEEEALIEFIEGGELEGDLREIVGREWARIEAESAVKRNYSLPLNLSID